MKINRIALHTFVWLDTNSMISTVEFCGKYETMVMFDDGDEIECYRSDTLEEARAKHNELVHKWNDRLYEGSIAKVLGAMNYGQFVTAVKTC